MRAFKALMGSLFVMTVLVGSILHAQDPPVQVEISTHESRTVWYTDPVWLVVGGVILILLIALIVSASRRDGGTTIIKD